MHHNLPSVIVDTVRRNLPVPSAPHKPEADSRAGSGLSAWWHKFCGKISFMRRRRDHGWTQAERSELASSESRHWKMADWNAAGWVSHSAKWLLLRWETLIFPATLLLLLLSWMAFVHSPMEAQVSIQLYPTLDITGDN